MARHRLKLAPAPKSENARRHLRVFSMRLTAHDRELLERAAAAAYPYTSRRLARYIRAAALAAARVALGVKR